MTELPRLLLVDDDAALLRLIERMCRQHYHVSRATDGQEALDCWDAFRPDIVVADWQMPRVDGLELCRRVRRDLARQSVHFIVLTACDESRMTVRALDAGADDFVVKPFDHEILMARIRAGERNAHLLREIRARCRAEAECNHLRDAMAAQEQMITVLAHEFRTPLAGLRAALEILLLDGSGPTEETKDALARMHEQILRLGETAESLLATTLLEGDRWNWQWSRCEPAAIAREAVECVEPLAAAKGIEVSYSCEPHDLAMQGDVVALRRLIINLLANAIRHTRQGTVAVDVHESPHRPQHVDFRVTDTGSGISPETLRRLAQPFALNSGLLGESHTSGTGLGLAICRGIATAHGGTLHFESRLGVGTTVTASLRADLPAPHSTMESSQRRAA